jgi:hypothetical protein
LSRNYAKSWAEPHGVAGGWRNWPKRSFRWPAARWNVNPGWCAAKPLLVSNFSTSVTRPCRRTTEPESKHSRRLEARRSPVPLRFAATQGTGPPWDYWRNQRLDGADSGHLVRTQRARTSNVGRWTVSSPCATLHVWTSEPPNLVFPSRAGSISRRCAVSWLPVGRFNGRPGATGEYHSKWR